MRWQGLACTGFSRLPACLLGRPKVRRDGTNDRSRATRLSIYSWPKADARHRPLSTPRQSSCRSCSRKPFRCCAHRWDEASQSSLTATFPFARPASTWARASLVIRAVQHHSREDVLEVLRLVVDDDVCAEALLTSATLTRHAPATGWRLGPIHGSTHKAAHRSALVAAEVTAPRGRRPRCCDHPDRTQRRRSSLGGIAVSDPARRCPCRLL